MKRPRWATVVGILGIILGFIGILGAGQITFTPKFVELQHKAISEIQPHMFQDDEWESMRDRDSKLKDIPPPTPEMFEHMLTMFELPDWFRDWSLYSGITKALISIFYLFASISLLRTKPSSIRFFCWAVGLSILFCITNTIATISAMGITGSIYILGGIVGVLINIVLIIVVAMGDKEAYQAPLPVPATTE